MIREFKAACRGCHGGCIHILTVEDGKVTRVRPDPDGPLNNGHACTKGITIIEQMYHPDRLLRPRKRIGERGSGQWEDISWDEALDTIARELTRLSEESGPECIATITGTGRHMVPYLWRFTNALGSPNITSAGALICLGPRKNAGYSTSGTYGCVDYYGETEPKCIVAWGANPTTSGADGELQWHPRRCAADGTKFIVIDPQKTELAEKADLWLRLRPGTDGALAMGLINIIIEEELYDHEFVNKWTYGFEKLKERARSFTAERVSRTTWIPEDQLYAAARLMAKETPMTLEWGCAIDQSFNSTNTCRAIYFLPALLGSYVAGERAANRIFAQTFHRSDKADDDQTFYFDNTATTDALEPELLFVITSSYTSGAAEWLIRALRNVLGEANVYVVGQTTNGQIVITEEIHSEYYVTINPAVAFVADENGDYSYASGIRPDVEINEMSYVQLYPYGDENEVILSAILGEVDSMY